MTINAYMTFQPYNGGLLNAEAQVDLSKNTEPLVSAPTPLAPGKVFSIDDFSLDVAQTLNIGSQSAGAGKVTFNPFSITRNVDCISPVLFQMACSGTPFETVTLALARSVAGGPPAGQFIVRFDFKLVAVKTVAWKPDPSGPKEQVTFEYGGLQVRYSQQGQNGALMTPVAAGWNAVKNIQDLGAARIG